jgi:ABC-2 type transport system ATP-binding protein
MEEADQCDRVALMHRGRIAALDTPAALKAAFPCPLYRVTGLQVRALHAFFAGQSEVRATQLFGDSLHVSFRRPPAPSDWERWQRQADGGLSAWSVQPPSIEDVFMELTEDAA